jgi:hypothetical protein
MFASEEHAHIHWLRFRSARATGDWFNSLPIR